MTDLTQLRAAVLEWYRPRRQAYAWRRGRRNAYRTLVSEVMLQQTQAARVEPIFEAFVARFPRVDALAAASRADVLRAWSGLGYNRRAVALHEAARAVVRDHGGRVPRDVDALVQLPGVGPYTAAAVASIGYGDAVAALDGNVRRVAARAIRGAEPDEVPAADLDERRAGVARSDRPRRLEPGDHGHRTPLLPAGPAVRGLSTRASMPVPRRRPRRQIVRPTPVPVRGESPPGAWCRGA